jgi:aminoglycoside phosphotransferase (APT) family kinase protein
MSSKAHTSTPADAIKDQKVISWIEKNIGGKVERCERQSRWRGGWWVDLRLDGKVKELYVREERKEDYPPWPLEHEAGVLQVLEKHGVLVPHVYGICDDPHATVMDKLPGHADFRKLKDEAERVAVLEHFAEIAAKMHAIPPEELVKIGVKMPVGDAEISLACFEVCEKMYLRGKKQPEPRVEFLRRWIRNNIPKNRQKISIVAVDSGQFLFEDGKVTGLYDFEYGCLGDPMIDLAFIPLRLSMSHVGDMKPFFKRYAEVTGVKFDPAVLTFHTVWWILCTPFILTADLQDPPAHATYFEYVGWYIGAVLTAFMTLANLKGLEFPNKLVAPPAEPSRWGKIFDVMAARVPAPAPNEPYEVTEQRNFLQLAKRMDAQRDIEDLYIQEVVALLQRPIKDWRQADEELEKFVMTAGPEHDETLISLFYRWSWAEATVLVDGLAHLPMLQEPYQKFTDMIP